MIRVAFVIGDYPPAERKLREDTALSKQVLGKGWTFEGGETAVMLRTAYYALERQVLAGR